MFEGTNRKGLISESAGALVYLVAENPVRTGIYVGAIPFVALWIVRNSVATAFTLQVYLITTEVFVRDALRRQPGGVGRRRFWRAMLTTGAVAHPVVVAGVWYLDLWYRSFVTGGATLFLLVIVCSVVEAVTLRSAIAHFWPEDASHAQRS